MNFIKKKLFYHNDNEFQGFQVLCEREWLNFGHKFADRCGQTVGSEDPNERCPVFLQWLDCVHQLINQFKCSFQMSPAYLVSNLESSKGYMYREFTQLN